MLPCTLLPLHAQVVLEEGAGRKVIFSTFDPDCAALLSLKQPRFPVFFLTCGGTKLFQVCWPAGFCLVNFRSVFRVKTATSGRWNCCF